MTKRKETSVSVAKEIDSKKKKEIIQIFRNFLKKEKFLPLGFNYVLYNQQHSPLSHNKTPV